MHGMESSACCGYHRHLIAIASPTGAEPSLKARLPADKRQLGRANDRDGQGCMRTTRIKDGKDTQGTITPRKDAEPGTTLRHGSARIGAGDGPAVRPARMANRTTSGEGQITCMDISGVYFYACEFWLERNRWSTRKELSCGLKRQRRPTGAWPWVGQLNFIARLNCLKVAEVGIK